MARLPVAVIDEEANPPRVVTRLASVAAAEGWIAEREPLEPEKVHRGGYGIDAPEEMINP